MSGVPGLVSDVRSGRRLGTGHWMLDGQTTRMQPSHRLRASADFERARKLGRSWGNDLLVLHAAPSAGQATRCGFSVSRRVGGAVARNRVRRRLREIVRHRLTAITGHWDLVVSARPRAATAGYRELSAAVDNLFRRGGLVPASPVAAERES